MATTLKKFDRPKTPVWHARFVRRNTASTQARNQNGSQLYNRARYYDTSTGEFCSRDPLEYVDGMSMSRGTFILNKLDPYGERSRIVHVVSNQRVADPAGPNVGTICAIPLLEKGVVPDAWLDEANLAGDHVLTGGASTPDQILEFVKKKGCCTVYLVGHQGGDLLPPPASTPERPRPNPGGMVTYPDADNPKDPTYIFPNKDLEDSLALEFRKNCGEHCIINLYACGGITEEHRKRRREIANRTGCLVCGAVDTISPGGGFPEIEKGATICTLGEPVDLNDGVGGVACRGRWRPECEEPSHGGWGTRNGRCIRWETRWVQNDFFDGGYGRLPVRECVEWEKDWYPTR